MHTSILMLLFKNLKRTNSKADSSEVLYLRVRLPLESLDSKENRMAKMFLCLLIAILLYGCTTGGYVVYFPSQQSVTCYHGCLNKKVRCISRCSFLTNIIKRRSCNNYCGKIISNCTIACGCLITRCKPYEVWESY